MIAILLRVAWRSVSEIVARVVAARSESTDRLAGLRRILERFGEHIEKARPSSNRARLYCVSPPQVTGHLRGIQLPTATLTGLPTTPWCRWR